MRRHYAKLLALATVAILAMVGYIFYLLFGPYKTASVGRIRTTSPIVAGSLMRYDAENCRPNNRDAQISRVIQGIDQDIVIGAGAELRTFHCSNILLIPRETPTGRYKLIITARYSVNPLRSVLRVYNSDEFQVNNPESSFTLPPHSNEPVIIPVPLIQSPGVAPPRSPTASTPPSAQPPPPPTPPPGPIQQLLNNIKGMLGL